MRYWDTSALLKLYVTEPDSARFRARASATGPVLTSDVARWELFVALQRKEAAGDITQGTAQAFYSQFEMDVAAARVVVLAADAKQLPGFQTLVKKLYQRQPPHLIRTLDALHLAAAQAGQADRVRNHGPAAGASGSSIGFAAVHLSFMKITLNRLKQCADFNWSRDGLTGWFTRPDLALRAAIR